jgi:Fe-Mn family superoxide dismutase
MPAYSELTRRLGFEYNGMVLHEYYFGNMKQGGMGAPEQKSVFLRATEESFGSYDTWKADFVGIGKMRGVGWAICYENPVNERSPITGSRFMRQVMLLALIQCL